MTRDVYAAIDRAELVEEPFPHLVAEDALPAEVADALLESMPPLEVFTQQPPSGSAARHALPSPLALADPRIPEAWKQALARCVSDLPRLLDRFRDRLGERLLALYPDWPRRFGPLSELHVTPRHQSGRRHDEVGMDAQVVVNRPALSDGTSVRGAHLDMPDKLISGLIYIRPRDDQAEGGDLELYAPTVESLTFDETNHAPADAVRLVRTYRRCHNLMVLPLLGPRALHGVSLRSRSPHPRYHLHVVGELAAPLFEVPRHP